MIRSLAKNWLVFLILAALVFAAYSYSLGNGFVSDDHGLEQFLPQMNFQYLMGRPFSLLRNVVYFAEYKVFGLTPWALRLSNILFHVVNTFLAFLIVKKTANQTVAFLAAAVFAVHPLTVESVAWIAGGVYPQYAFFFLLSLYLYMMRVWYVGSILSFLFALFSSDKALPLFFIFPLYEWTYGSITRHWKRIVPYAIILLVVGVGFLFTNPFASRTSELIRDYYQPGGYDNPLHQIPSAFSSYFELFFWPQKLTLYHTELVFPAWEFAVRLIVTILFLIGVGLALLFRKKLAFWMVFFVIPLIPSLTPLRISWIVAERYAYLSTLAMAVMMSWIVFSLLKQKRVQAILFALYTIWIGLLITRTIFYTTAWKSDDTLWLAIDKYSPNSAQNHNNLGDLYGRRKDYRRSIEEYEKALKLNPYYGDVYNNLANTYAQMGQTEKAIETYEKALALNPRLWQTHQNIATLYINSKEFDRAIAEIQKALQIVPNNAKVWTNLGITFAAAGQLDKAIEAFNHALKLNPNEKGAVEGLKKINSFSGGS